MTKEGVCMATSTATVAAVVLLLLLSPLALAHGAAPPRQDFERRILADCEDDYFGGHDTGGKPGHDLHALDLREAWFADFGDTVVFRVTFDGQDEGRFVLTFQVDGSARTLEWVSADGTAWTGVGFDTVGGPFASRDTAGNTDGTRQVLDGIVSLATLGASVGSRLTGFLLVGYSGGQERDRVTGDAAGSSGGDGGACDGATFRAPFHQLAGPVQYARLTITSASPAIPVGEELFVDVGVENLLRREDARYGAQEMTLTVAGADGVLARFHDLGAAGYSDEAAFAVPRGGSGILHLVLEGVEAGATGALTLTLTTNMGGRVQATHHYEVATSDGAGPDPGPTESGRATSAAAALAMALLLAGLALRRRP